MMRNALMATAILFAFFALAVRAADPKPATQAGRPTLETTRWNLVQLKGAPAATDAQPYIVLHPNDLSFEGAGGVNPISGTYTLTGQQLRFTLGIQTHRARAGAASGQERDFFHALSTVDTYRIDGNALLLLVDDQVVAKFQAG